MSRFYCEVKSESGATLMRHTFQSQGKFNRSSSTQQTVYSGNAGNSGFNPTHSTYASSVAASYYELFEITVGRIISDPFWVYIYDSKKKNKLRVSYFVRTDKDKMIINY